MDDALRIEAHLVCFGSYHENLTMSNSKKQLHIEAVPVVKYFQTKERAGVSPWSAARLHGVLDSLAYTPLGEATPNRRTEDRHEDSLVLKLERNSYRKLLEIS